MLRTARVFKGKIMNTFLLILAVILLWEISENIKVLINNLTELSKKQDKNE
jgi:hypothetical protein